MKFARLLGVASNAAWVRFVYDRREICCNSHNNKKILILKQISKDYGIHKISINRLRYSGDGSELIFPVNAIAFHPRHNTFASGGTVVNGITVVW